MTLQNDKEISIERRLNVNGLERVDDINKLMTERLLCHFYHF